MLRCWIQKDLQRIYKSTYNCWQHTLDLQWSPVSWGLSRTQGDPLSEGSPASQSDIAPCHGHHPCLQIPTHHTVNIKKTLKPLKGCEIKTDCLPGFHICPVSFFSFFPRLSIVYQIPNFWSFLLVIIIILTNICLPLMCLYLWGLSGFTQRIYHFHLCGITQSTTYLF